MGQIITFPDMVKRLDNPPNRLREVRNAMREGKGMTLKEVADRLGTTATVVSRWETGERPVVMEQFKRLARIYGTDVGQLLNAEDNFTSLSDQERVVILAMRQGPPHVADAVHAVAESMMRFGHEPAEAGKTG